jgi:hypothetical protein
VPPFNEAPAPQREHTIQRSRQRSHIGWPVAREVVHRPVRPQMPQTSSGRGRQRVQIGPASVIAATRRWSPQLVQALQLLESRHQQGWQTG